MPSGPKRPRIDAATGLPQTRAARGLRAIGQSVAAAAGPAVRRQGIQKAELVSRWAEIVGADIAAMTRPLEIRHGRSKKQAGAVLYIGAAPKAALLLGHQENEIVARINTYFGTTLVVGIAFIERRTFAPKPQKPAEKTAENRDPLPQKVQDSRLQKALERLHGQIADPKNLVDK